MKIKLKYLQIRLFLLHVTAHPHSAKWVQLLWAAVERLIMVSG
jgi:hypothetical protein